MDNERTNRPQRDSQSARDPKAESPADNARDRMEDARSSVKDGAEGVGSIFGEVVEDLQNIVRGEVQLAKTEMKEEATQMGKGAGMVGAGVFFGLIGFIFVMLAVTYLLAEWMEMWIAAGIVGLALVIIAVIPAMTGKGQIDNVNIAPEQTIDSLKEDKEWANRQMKSAGR